MMHPLQTFHLFPKLPPELQDLIWDHAVRPVPGSRHVHNFILSDHLLPHIDSRRKVPGDRLKLDFEDRRSSGIRLSVPHTSNRYKWKKSTAALDGLKDDSVYSTDSGLWMACRASRSAMTKYFNDNEWWSDLPGSDQPHLEEEASHQNRPVKGNSWLSKTSAYYSSGEDEPCHEAHWITICPDRDLMILKHPGLQFVDWFHFYAYNWTAINPFFLGCHVAIDYDPVWLDIWQGLMLRRCPVRITADSGSIIDMICAFNEVNEGEEEGLLWLIDHRLKRRPREQPNKTQDEKEEDRLTFRSVNYTFTEVKREDMEVGWILEDHVEDAGSVFEFIDAFDNQPALGDIASTNRVRVLARELVPGSEGTVTITKTGYRNLLGDACFEYPETKIQMEIKKPRRNLVEDDEDDDIDLENFSLFGDDKDDDSDIGLVSIDIPGLDSWEL